MRALLLVLVPHEHVVLVRVLRMCARPGRRLGIRDIVDEAEAADGKTASVCFAMREAAGEEEAEGSKTAASCSKARHVCETANHFVSLQVKYSTSNKN